MKSSFLFRMVWLIIIKKLSNYIYIYIYKEKIKTKKNILFEITHVSHGDYMF